MHRVVPELGLTVWATPPTIRNRFVKSAASVGWGDAKGQSMNQTRRFAFRVEAGGMVDSSRVVVSVARGRSCRNAKGHEVRSEEDSDEMSPLLGR